MLYDCVFPSVHVAPTYPLPSFVARTATCINECSIAAGCNLAVLATARGQHTLVRRLLAAAPVVSSGPPRNVVGCGSQTVTTTGLHFWSTDYTVSTLLAAMACSTSSWSSTTSLMCAGSLDSAGGSYVHTTIGSVLSTASTLFSFDGVMHAVLALWSCLW